MHPPVVLIDGENLKGKIRAICKAHLMIPPQWHMFDFKKLFTFALSTYPKIDLRVYFGKLKEHPESLETSRRLIHEQRLLKTHLETQGFTVILTGRVRGQYEENSIGTRNLVFREKGVDVRMAVDMVKMAYESDIQDIHLCSSDSDLQPAVQEVRSRKILCTYIGFSFQPNRGLMHTTSKHILIRDSEVLECTSI
jgi:uncharacterized LabA/DUF88 family protein